MKSVVSIVEIYRSKGSSFLVWVLSLFLGLSLTSCDFSQFMSTEDLAKPPIDLKKEKIFRIALWGEIPHFNPFYPTSEALWSMQALVWEPFVMIGPQGQMQAHLAQSWKFLQEGRVAELSLRPQLVWSDGKVVTLKDLKFSFEFFKYDILKAAHWKEVFNDIEKIDYQGSRLRITLNHKGSFERWRSILSMARLLPFSTLESFKNDKKLIKGTGPYTLFSFSSTQPWYLQKNKRSWYLKSLSKKNLKGSSAWAKTDIKVVADWIQVQKVFSTSVAKSMLRQKKVDALVDFGALSKEETKTFTDYGFQSFFIKNKIKNLLFNLKQNKLKNTKVRQCLAQSLPKKQDLKKIIPSKSKILVKITSLKCQEVLNSLSFKVHYTQEEDKKFLSFWQEEVRALGLSLDLEKVGQRRWNQLLKSKNFDLLISEGVKGADSYLYSIFHSQGDYNAQSWDFKDLDQILKKKQLNFDPISRAKQSLQVKALVEQKYKGLVPIYEWPQKMAWIRTKCLKNKEKMPFWWSLIRCAI